MDSRLTARDRQRTGSQAGSLVDRLLSLVVTGRQTDMVRSWTALDRRRDRPTDRHVDRPWTGVDRQVVRLWTDAERQVTGIDRQKTSMGRQQTDNDHTAVSLATDQNMVTSSRHHERTGLHERHEQPVAHTSSPLQMAQDLYKADLSYHQATENNTSRMQHYHDRPYA